MYASSMKDGFESLILEDLTGKGYELKDRTKPLDLDHCKIVIENFALLHSVSFVLKKRDEELFERLSDLPETFFYKDFLEYYKGLRMKNSHERLSVCLDPEKERGFVDKLDEFIKRFFEDFDVCLSKKEANNFVVISHGDSWLNNIFFKYQVIL